MHAGIGNHTEKPIRKPETKRCKRSLSLQAKKNEAGAPNFLILKIHLITPKIDPVSKPSRLREKRERERDERERARRREMEEEGKRGVVY